MHQIVRLLKNNLYNLINICIGLMHNYETFFKHYILHAKNVGFKINR